ncbi:hypothetical protein H261_03203 [Paramagnetospirillum caucaseum]|uniref:DUF6950 domain-containing protein n=1 Tax=Paramagnetospirillum caucaseum TaxID=1244869 RepID=M3AEU9_9PROT|nr:hypothetical protein [Paramagnetospirillum caucaseum]EME71383.1 hypothetical protein H261_03203 [Paramagnetospirillum caucaseum]
MLTRFQDWPVRLDAAIAAARAVPFGYGPGQSHCCLFSSGVVQAITGTDVYAWFRGRYRCERGAYVALRRFAGGDVPEAVARIAAECGAPEIPLALAGRGDVVLFDTPEGPAMGICLGAHLVSVTRPHGLGFLPMSAATRAWKV